MTEKPPSKHSAEGLGPTGRRIDLGQFKKTEKLRSEFSIIREGRQRLEATMARMAEEANQRFMELGGPRIVGDDGRLDMTAFEPAGLPVADDIKKVQEIQQQNLLGNPEIQRFQAQAFRDAHSDREPENDAELLNFCVERRKDSLSNVCEMAVTALLQKKLGDRYIVVRSSEIDDLVHSSDGYIFDTVTKARLCSIDEYTVHEEATRGVGGTSKTDETREKKSRKQKQIMDRGGATLTYGFEIEQQGGEERLRLGQVENIPIFVAALKKKDLLELLAALPKDTSDTLSSVEDRLFDELITSLGEQAAHFAGTVSNHKLKANIEIFQQALADIKAS